MRKAKILYKNEDAGILTQLDDGSFTFLYNYLWLQSNRPDISLTLPKSEKEFHSKFLFPFFFNMLPEGTNKQQICKHFKIEPTDHFSILLSVAQFDTIGAVKVVKIK